MASAEQVVAALQDAPRVLLVTHTHPDGDALGSITALRLALRRLDIPVEVFVSEQDAVLPDELEGLAFGDAVDERLAALPGEQGHERIAVGFEEISEAVERRGALLGGRRRPAAEAGLGERHETLDMGGGRVGDHAGWDGGDRTVRSGGGPRGGGRVGLEGDGAAVSLPPP